MCSRQGEHDLSGADLDRVDGRRLEGRHLEGLTSEQGELATVLPALQESLVLNDLTFGKRDVLVRAAVADGVDIITDAYDCYGEPLDVETPCFASCQILEPTEGYWVSAQSAQRRGTVSPEALRSFRSQLTEGEDVVDPATWTGSVPQAHGITPRVRIGRSRWFNLLWLLPIGFVVLIFAVAAAKGLREAPSVQRFIDRSRTATVPR